MPSSQAALPPLPHQTSLPSPQPLKPWHWRSLPLNHRTGSEVFAALYLDLRTMRPHEAIATLLESPAPSPPPSEQAPEEQSKAAQTTVTQSKSAQPKSVQPTATPPLSNIPDHQRPRYSICAGAPRVIEGLSQHWVPSMGNHLATLQHLMKRSPNHSIGPESELRRSELRSSGLEGADVIEVPAHLPFHGGWLGWLGYDVAWEIEVLPEKNTDPLPFPVSFWYEPTTFAVLDHQEQRIWLAATKPDDLNTLSDRLSRDPQTPDFSKLSHRPQRSIQNPKPVLSLSNVSKIQNPKLPLTFLSNQHDYERVVQQAKAHIQAGDIFQANLSLRFSTQTAASSWSIYQSLQQVNPSPFSSYWHTPWGDVVSCSPERLVKVRGQVAETRPIAGTRPRGASVEADLAYEEELTNNCKENAEHIMLVDLERNDLGRVCQWGTVKVDELLTIERYSHVMHLVSNVVGTLDADHNVIDVIQALFPGGTITGCPKVRCMEIIEDLEPVRRSLFYGSCGYLDQRGVLDLNILIRTLLCEPQPLHSLISNTPNSQEESQSPHPLTPLRTVWGQVGAGIVADSDPTREWIESLSKAKAQLDALELAHQVPIF